MKAFEGGKKIEKYCQWETLSRKIGRENWKREKVVCRQIGFKILNPEKNWSLIPETMQIKSNLEAKVQQPKPSTCVEWQTLKYYTDTCYTLIY